jgi:hypothetical protein
VIVKGQPVRDWGLGGHLTSSKNDRVEMIGSRGVASDDIRAAIKELDAYKIGLGARKNLAHFHISPSGDLDANQWARAWAEVEAEYGLSDCPFVEVEHEKLGRTHRHRVYSRLDLQTGKTVQFGYNFVRNEKLEHELGILFGEPIVPGKHSRKIISRWQAEGRADAIAALRSAERGKDSTGRPDTVRSTSWAEHQQAERTKTDISMLAEIVAKAWSKHDDPAGFRAELYDAGLVLARGDRRGIVLVDPQGGVHALARILRRTHPEIRTAEIDRRLGALHRSLPSVAVAQEYLRRERPDLASTAAIDDQARSTGSKAGGARVDSLVLTAWRSTDDPAVFRDRLAAAGLILARGDRRGLVIVDRDGNVQSLTRILRRADNTISADAVRTRLAPIARDLPRVAQLAARSDRGGEGTDRSAEPAGDRGSAAGPTQDGVTTDDGARAARRRRRAEAQRRRRDDERAGRREIYALADDALRHRHAASVSTRYAAWRSHTDAAWQAERHRRASELDRIRTRAAWEEQSLYGTLPPGVLRTMAILLHRRLSTIELRNARKRHSAEWAAVKVMAAPRPRRESYHAFLDRVAPTDEVAAALLRRAAQRRQGRDGIGKSARSRAADRDRGPGRE